MRLARTKNAISGTVYGILLRFYRIVGPFVIRTVFLHTLGVEYLGLDSLFTSIIQMLNIAELGVGSALVFSMYEPIAENNDEKICALLRLYEIYYRIIGAVILVMGLFLTPFLPRIIHGSVPSNINLYVIYYMNLFTTVLSYWVFAYRNSLFNAFQRTDVISRVGIITNTFRYVFQIILLLVLKNYYWYLMISLMEQLLNNLSMAVASKKYFPQYRPRGVVDDESRKKITRTVKDLFYSKIGMVVNNSFDTIVISAFLGLSILAIYQNYYYIVSSLIAIFAIFYKACLAGVGNSLITEGQEKNYRDFKRISYIVCLLLSFSCTCLFCLYPPFMKIWLKKDELLLNQTYIILFVSYFFFYEITMLLELYKDAAGNWHKDRFRPLIAAFVNLASNIILVRIIGLYGIIISTILSYVFINLPWIYRRLFGDVFSGFSGKDYLHQLIKYSLLIVGSVIISKFFCVLLTQGSEVLNFFLYLAVCSIISITVFVIATFQQEEFKWAMSFFRNIVVLTKKKLRKG